jgi:hypothetical protein
MKKIINRPVNKPGQIKRAHFPHIGWDGTHVQKRFHSGKTDFNYGHQDRTL